ncbi:MAG: phosphoribosylamine--glycine ligase [Treponema sp.]|jgi:phosphoribosylamine--glycine ligase|nr:phosphoribosylamine--glycine ligase [Treponema sp.]
MRVAVIGSGGREHAIAWKLAQSERVERVYVVPGNGGTAMEAKCENVPLDASLSGPEGQEAIIAFVRERNIGLTVVGPEEPLAAGLADCFRAAGLAVAGPGRDAARLEASKAFAKEFMKKYGVRAPASREFSDPRDALDYAGEHFAPSRRAADSGGAAPPPLVIKADGLAAGKGVVVAPSFDAAAGAINAFMRDRTLGGAGDTVLIEDFLAGREISILAAVDAGPGRRGLIRPFIAARDHKSRFENGKGPNTGGMGAIAPAPDFTESCRRDFTAAVLEPTLRGLEAEGLDYRGFLFFGLMISGGRCYLLEYNVRLGDPETQAVLPLLDSDFFELCQAVALGGLPSPSGPPVPGLQDIPLVWKPGAVCAPAAVAEGYPGPYRRGDPISIDRRRLAETGAALFAAGARQGEDGREAAGLYTNGGRVLVLSALGRNPEEARTRAYAAMEAIHFTGMGFRRDIGLDGPAPMPGEDRSRREAASSAEADRHG